MNTRKIFTVGLFILASFVIYGWDKIEKPLQAGKDWPNYGGNKEGNRYSPLDQINTKNVTALKVAWMYDAAVTKQGDIQCQPIVIDGILYGTTPDLNLFALNAATGEQIWKFAASRGDRPNQNRGVMYWEEGEDKRILYSISSGLYAVNAKTGELVKSFGTDGRVDLHEGLQTNLDHDVSKLSVNATSPGIIYKNILIIGSAVSEGGDAAPGHIRAFDVVTGKLLWVFHTIPQPGEYGYNTWPKDAYKKMGGTNSWSGMTLDEKRGVVYLGTGSPSADFYGGARAGANLFANCIVALDAQSGKLKWYYQTIHHDLWDRDHPCPPNLGTVKHNGKKVDVVVQATKDGLVYVLDRDKGTSLFPVEERPVPTTALPGEHPFPTQKFPLKPAPFARQTYTEADISNLSPESHAYVKEQFLKIKTNNKWTPPSTNGTLLFGYSGGAEWGGNAIDPDGILYQNSNEEPWELKMSSRETAAAGRQKTAVTPGNALYLTNCSSCHGQDRKGSGPELPSLINVEKRRTMIDIRNLLKTGSGRMPSFQHLSIKDRNLIVSFITNTDNGKATVSSSELRSAASKTTSNSGFPYMPPYVSNPWKRFTDQNGYPGIKPPWGTLNAIDLNTGEYLWKIPLGEYPELAKKGVPTTGTVSYGGPLVTAGGLVFIAGTKDEKIRAFDKKTGVMVWEFQLPAGGFATPITYEVNGKQFIVIAAGGGRQQKLGGNYVAFGL
jgi:quinoprotein glucose dehydrogenase